MNFLDRVTGNTGGDYYGGNLQGSGSGSWRNIEGGAYDPTKVNAESSANSSMRGEVSTDLSSGTVWEQIEAGRIFAAMRRNVGKNPVTLTTEIEDGKTTQGPNLVTDNINKPVKLPGATREL